MQRYFAIDKNENKFILRESDIHHIKKVMRLKNDDLIEVVFNNKLYHSIVTENEFIIKEKIEINSTEFRYVNLIIPLLKEQKLDYILQKATELGVSKITLVDTERSVIKLEDKKEAKKIERWISIAREAAEQSKRLDIPEIIYEKKLLEVDGVKIICSPTSTKSIKNHLKTLEVYDKLNIVIGPEGGLSKKEEAYYINKGFTAVSLGSRIMRAETVPLFIMSIINYEYMEWYYERNNQESRLFPNNNGGRFCFLVCINCIINHPFLFQRKK